MVDKIIFTVTPIFSITPHSASALEIWMHTRKFPYLCKNLT